MDLLYLYPSNQTSFATNGDPIHNVFDDHVIRDNGYYLKFRVTIDKSNQHKKLKKEMIVSAVINQSGRRDQFYIYEIVRRSDYIEVTALQLRYYLRHRLVRGVNGENISGTAVIDFFANAFVGDISPFHFASSITERHTFSTKEREGEEEGYHNALEVLEKIAIRWNADFDTNGYNIRMAQFVGQSTEALLYERKNISDFEDSDSASELITRIHATSKWTINSGEPGYVEGGNNEREIKIVVDSPLINEYARIYEASYTNNEMKTEADLRRWAGYFYSHDNVDKPVRSIKVDTNIIDGTRIEYGDRLVLKYSIHDIDMRIQCVGIDFSPTRRTYYSVTLGNVTSTFSTAVQSKVSEVSKEQRRAEEESRRKVEQIIQDMSDGQRRMIHGPNPIPNPNDGDIWFYYELDNPNNIETRIWDAELGQWVKDDFDKTLFEEKMRELNSQIETLTAERSASEQKVADALNRLGLQESAMARANEVLGEINSRVSATDTWVLNARNILRELQSHKQIVDTWKNEMERTDRLYLDRFTAIESTQRGDKSLLNELRTTASETTRRMSSVEQDQDRLLVQINTTTQTVNGLRTEMNSYNQTLAGYRSNVATYEQTVNQFRQSLTTKTDAATVTSMINTKAGEITRELSKVENKIPTSIGGRNYIIDSENKVMSPYGGARLTVTPNQSVAEWNTSKAFRVTGTVGTRELFGVISPNRNDEELLAKDYEEGTYSIYIKNSGSVNLNVNSNGNSGSMNVAPGEVKRVVISGKRSRNDLSYRQFTFSAPIGSNVDFHYWRPKIELGLLVSDWSPAPEDNILKTEFNTVTEKVNFYERLIGTSSNDGTARSNISRMVMTSDLFQMEVSRIDDRAAIVARLGDGVHMTDDYYFENGYNGVSVYDNSNTNSISMYREVNVAGNSHSTGQPNRLRIVHTASNTSPSLGGIYRMVRSRANAEFIVRFSALLPTGRRFEHASNSLGNRKELTWLTSPEGTGRFTEYMYYVKCGDSGTFNTFGFTYVTGGPNPTQASPLTWYLASYDIIDITQSNGMVLTSKITQLSDSISLGLFNQKGLVSGAQFGKSGVYIKGSLIHLDGNVTMNQAFIKDLMVTKATADTITAFMGKFSNIVASKIDASKITAGRADFLTAGFRALNSHGTLNGNRFRIDRAGGGFVEMNAWPEVRSTDAAGISVVMGNGRSQYFNNQQSVGYIGVNLATNQDNFGIFLSHGTGSFSINAPTTVKSSNDTVHVVRSGETLSRIASRYGVTIAHIRSLNNIPNPDLITVGDTFIIHKGTINTTAGAIAKAWEIGKSSDGDYRIYHYRPARYNLGITVDAGGIWIKSGGFKNDSDRRLKHDIHPTDITALDHIRSLSFKKFKWNRDGSQSILGLIAQDAGILSVQNPDGTYGIDMERMIYLGVKGVQEVYSYYEQLEKRIKELESKIA